MQMTIINVSKTGVAFQSIRVQQKPGALRSLVPGDDGIASPTYLEGTGLGRAPKLVFAPNSEWE